MAKNKSVRKIFVLDTSVILYEHNSILNFQEHDIGIPITVLEELDHFKKGNDSRNFEAREFSRLIDKLSTSQSLQEWIPLNGKTRGSFKVLMSSNSKVDASEIFGADKPDHRILNAALQIKEEMKDRPVILVTKDINLRLKAKSLNLQAEDYTTGKIQNVSSLYTGSTEVDDINPEQINYVYENGGIDIKRLFSPNDVYDNQYLILKNGKKSALTFVNPTTEQVEKVEKI